MANTLNVYDAWNAVALEERLELISKAKAQGIIFATAVAFLIGAAAYGYDSVYLMFFGMAVALIAFPMSTGRIWRRCKSELILTYLAVRSVARRYGYAYKVPYLDIVLIFRGEYELLYSSDEEKALSEQYREVDFDASTKGKKEVWVCLLRGAVILLSERLGGAKLEFINNIGSSTNCRKPTADESKDGRALVISSGGPHQTKNVLISSKYPGALYVFEKRLGQLIHEAIAAKEHFEKKRLLEQESSKKQKRQSRI